MITEWVMPGGGGCKKPYPSNSCNNLRVFPIELGITRFSDFFAKTHSGPCPMLLCRVWIDSSMQKLHSDWGIKIYLQKLFTRSRHKFTLNWDWVFTSAFRFVITAPPIIYIIHVMTHHFITTCILCAIPVCAFFTSELANIYFPSAG